MSTEARYSCSSLKMPGITLYLGSFIAIQSIIYCIYSILSFFEVFNGGMSLPITILSAAALPLFTFFCNISMLYFGRIYRKSHKSSYWDWTSLCYSVLILLDIAFLIAAFAPKTGGMGIFVERHALVFAAFATNIFIPFFLVPLPSAIGCGSSKRFFLLLGMLCHFLGMLLMWILGVMIMAQACEERAFAVRLFKEFPFKLFLNIHATGFFAIMSIIALVLVIIGYLSHFYIVTANEGYTIAHAFSKKRLPVLTGITYGELVIVLAFAPFIINILLFSCSASLYVSIKNVTIDSFKPPLSIENLEMLYYNGENPDDEFWHEFNSKAKGFERQDSAKEAFDALSAMIDKVERIPKCRRDFSSFLMHGTSRDLDAVTDYCVKLLMSIDSAIEKKNVSEAMALARRALKIDSYLLGDIYASAGLLHMRLCTILALFTKSGIATSDNLSEIRNAMVENEKAVDGFYKNVNYWHALCLIELWKIRESENMMEVGDDSMPVPSLNELKYLFPQQHCAYLRLFGRDMGSAKEGGNNVIVRMREEALRACRLLTSD